MVEVGVVAHPHNATRPYLSRGMRGYQPHSYGDGMADVYDDWYAHISDVNATVATLTQLAHGGRVLELGVGTGRLAAPLAATGVEVHGIDASDAMLRQIVDKSGGSLVHTVLGDMVTDLPVGPFALVFVAYNTLFNLPSEALQQACFHAVASRLAPGGYFAIEAFVPEPAHEPASSVDVRSLTTDRVVLSISTSDPSRQVAEGQYVDITESGGVRLRPWSIRWATVGQLDAMAGEADLSLAHRWADFDRSPFNSESPRHVSVYAKRG